MEIFANAVLTRKFRKNLDLAHKTRCTVMKDEKKHHGGVDESLSEQQFHKLDKITVVV